jgi:SagB-type dehydrogenase family enzyme
VGNDPRHYHERTKHQPNRYAASLGFLDWATQPDPFLRFAGAPLHRLPAASAVGPDYEDIREVGRVEAEPVDISFLGRLFYWSLALSAWKSIPGSTWPLRVNPSSGNLHPTEGYLLCGPEAGLADTPALYHYSPFEHGLEERARLTGDAWLELVRGCSEASMFVGLTSIHWREAWKYGERAYRYCQHDAGHAIAAVRYAAACLGWRADLVASITDAELSRLLGIADQSGVEAEHPGCLLLLHPGDSRPDLSQFRLLAPEYSLVGDRNVMSSDHHEWPAIDEVVVTCEKTAAWVPDHTQSSAIPTLLREPDSISAAHVIRRRRSAVAMDGKTAIGRAAFYRMLDACLPGAQRIPHDALPWRPRIHLAVFVHRVEGVASGIYLLQRAPTPMLREVIGEAAAWNKPAECPDHLPLFLLGEADAREAAKAASCHQDIAADGCFTIAMLGEFRDSLENDGPWFYRALHWEAGLIGQTLYLESEAAGIRSTGIG